MGNPRLRSAWQRIRRIVEHPDADSPDEMDIRILIIDPVCFGAQLRSRGEGRSPANTAGRLSNDVNTVIAELLQLEQNCAQTRVRFQCKLYRLPPILSLYLTDSVFYVQQYYFWSTRTDTISFPVLKFQNTQPVDGRSAIHSELEKHFDWIWKRASIGLKEYREEYSFGFEKGVLQVGTNNVYTDAAEARLRMQYLLSRAKDKITIQGISLHSFFSTRDNALLYQAFHNLLRDSDIELEVYFLDPDCAQAKIRSYREESFHNPTLRRED
jgi:hypothetical protein